MPAFAIMYIAAIVLSLFAALGLRNYSLAHTSTYFIENMATISTAQMPEDEMAKILEIARSYPEVQKQLAAVGYDADARFLNYIVPMGWILADLPLEKIPKWVRGHHTPKHLDSNVLQNPFYESNACYGSACCRNRYYQKDLWQTANNCREAE
ncbi:MAG: hypothetical protein ACE5I1_27335 [bacterium]